MSTFIAIIASIMMLATNAAWGRDRAAVLTGVDQSAAYGTPADNGIQATSAAQYRMDGKTLNPMQTSATPGATVVLTASRGGGMMPGRGGGAMQGSLSGRSNWGRSPMQGGFSGRSSWGHSSNRGHSFSSRPFAGRSFDRDRFTHRGFDRSRSFHRDFNRDRFHHRDHFFHGGFGHYPYRPYYYYPYRHYYPYTYYYPYGYYPYGYNYYGNPWYFYPYFSLSFLW